MEQRGGSLEKNRGFPRNVCKMWNILSRYLLFLVVTCSNSFYTSVNMHIAYVIHFRQLCKLFLLSEAAKPRKAERKVRDFCLKSCLKYMSRRFDIYTFLKHCIWYYNINVLLCDALVMDTLTSERKRRNERWRERFLQNWAKTHVFGWQKSFYENKALHAYKVYFFVPSIW